MGRRDAQITVVGDFAIFDGYASMNEYMVRGMARAGADVNPWPIELFPFGLSEEFLELLNRSRPHLDGPVMCGTWGWRKDLDCIVGPDLFIRQAWETSRFPGGWLPKLNRCRAVIATTVFVADALRDSGLGVPVEVVPDGIDPEVYTYQQRPPREELTTLIVGRSYDRKHHPEAIAGWQQAFADDPTARLIIKTAWADDAFPDVHGDPRIQFIDAIDPGRGLASLYQRADVLLSLGSEGTGIPMLEAMATGLPVIALTSEGQGDVCSAVPDAVLPVQPSHWKDCYESGQGPTGVQGVPDVSQVVTRLRWVASHRDEAADMGRRASDWVRQHRDVWNYGPDVLTVIADHGRHRTRHGRLAPARSTHAATTATARGG